MQLPALALLVVLVQAAPTPQAAPAPATPPADRASARFAAGVVVAEPLASGGAAPARSVPGFELREFAGAVHADRAAAALLRLTLGATSDGKLQIGLANLSDDLVVVNELALTQDGAAVSLEGAAKLPLELDLQQSASWALVAPDAVPAAPAEWRLRASIGGGAVQQWRLQRRTSDSAPASAPR